MHARPLRLSTNENLMVVKEMSGEAHELIISNHDQVSDGFVVRESGITSLPGTRGKRVGPAVGDLGQEESIRRSRARRMFHGNVGRAS